MTIGVPTATGPPGSGHFHGAGPTTRGMLVDVDGRVDPVRENSEPDIVDRHGQETAESVLDELKQRVRVLAVEPSKNGSEVVFLCEGPTRFLAFSMCLCVHSRAAYPSKTMGCDPRLCSGNLFPLILHVQ